MQNTSTLFKTKIKEASRQFQCRITIGDRIFTNEDIVDIKIDGNMQPQDGFMIGVTPSNMLDLTILNSGDTIYSTNQIKVEIGLNIGSTIEYILMGYYNIDDIVKTDYTIKFTAFDNMIKFETPYFSDLGENATLQQIVNELASKTGVQFTGSLPSYTVKKLEGFTCREVLGYVASLCGGNALINREGKFTIVVPKYINYSIDTSNYFDYKREEVTYKIGKISCKAGENELVKGSLGVDSMELQFENPWVTESILQDIYNKLNGFNYLGYSIKWQGDISLDLGDIVTITDKKGVVRKHPILLQKFNYTGGLTVEMGAKGESKNKNSFNSSGENSKKINRVVTELALVNKAFVDYARINDAEIVSLKAKDAEINNALIYKANIKDLDVINGKIQNLIAEDAKINNALINKADIVQLNAVSAKINVLEADSATIKTLVAGNITAENIQSNFLQTLQGWMLEGSIGNAQISDLNANKIRSGTVDTSLVTVAGPGGRLQISGNKLQVFDSKSGKLYERIMLGIDNNNNSSLVLRGADGNTVLITQDGLTKAGFTDGYNKLENNSLDSSKLDINSVVRRINGTTEKIESNVVNVGNKTLNVLLQEQTNTITEHGKSLSTQEARITANENSIKLKVDTQTYSQDKTTINKSIETTLTNSKAYADAKKSEAISTAATDATTKANAAKDSAVNTASADATSKANSAKDTAIAEAQKKADKALADSKLYINQEITTVNSNLSKATSDISVLKGQIALKVEQSDIDKTATTVKNELVTKIDGIEIGARNLILKSDIGFTSSGYGVKTYTLSESLLSGQKYTITLWGGISKGKTFGIWLGGGYTTVGFLKDKGDGSFVLTFIAPTTIGGNGKRNEINLYNYPNNIVGECNVIKIQLEKGTESTDYTRAQEDVDQAIADVITTTDTKISKAKADIKIETDKIALNVANLTTKTSTIETQLGDKATKAEVKTVSDKAASIEANLNGITQRVSSTESTISTHTTQIGAVDGKINTAKTDAINTAGADAQKKADIAKTDAISTASADATTKANNALKDGKSYTDTGLKPVKDTLATHTIEISSTKQHVSTIETNLGSITSRVSTVENKTTTIDGKVTAQETRLQAAEQKITPSAIISKISSQLSSTGKIENSVMKFDKNGILVSHTNVGTKTNMGADGFKILREEANGEMTEIGSLAEKSGLTVLRADEVYAQNVVGILRGDRRTLITYYVNTETGVDDEEHGSSTKPFKTLQYILDKLHKMLIPNITIYVSGSIYRNINILGFQGSGWLELIFQKDCRIYGQIVCKGCSNRLYLDGGKSQLWTKEGTVIDISQTDLDDGAILISECTWCRVQGFNIRANKSSSKPYPNGVNVWGSRCVCKWLDINNSYCAITAIATSSVYVEDCWGSNNSYGICANMGGYIAAGGDSDSTWYIPTGDTYNSIYINGGREWNTSTVQAQQSYWQPPPTPPTKIYEKYYSVTSTKSWRDNWGWRSDNNYIYQGQYGSNGNHRGFMYFDSDQIRSDLSGATIHAVELRLTRRGAGGSSAASSINLYGHAYDSSGGGYSLGTDFGWPGSFAWGEAKWISLPNSVGEQFKSGATHGLAIIGGDYMIFEAYAELWIKYEK